MRAGAAHAIVGVCWAAGCGRWHFEPSTSATSDSAAEDSFLTCPGSYCAGHPDKLACQDFDAPTLAPWMLLENAGGTGTVTAGSACGPGALTVQGGAGGTAFVEYFAGTAISDLHARLYVRVRMAGGASTLVRVLRLGSE